MITDYRLQIPHTDVVRIYWLDTEEELSQVVEHSPAEGIGVLTPAILQIIVSLVVEHLVGCQVHSSIQKLKHFILYSTRIYKCCPTVKPDRSQPRPQKTRASMSPMI